MSGQGFRADLMPDMPDHEYISGHAREYEQMRYRMALRLIERNMEISGAQVFDFGCGEGSFLRLLESQNANVTGCDPSQELAYQAKVECGGVECLSKIANASLDLLCCLNVTPFMSSIERATLWTEIQRTIKPGAHFIHIVLNDWAARPHSGKWSTNPKAFREMLESNGMVEVDRDFYGYYPIIRWSNKGGDRENRIYDNAVNFVPMFLRSKRSTGYVSLSKRR